MLKLLELYGLALNIATLKTTTSKKTLMATENNRIEPLFKVKLILALNFAHCMDELDLTSNSLYYFVVL